MTWWDVPASRPRTPSSAGSRPPRRAAPRRQDARRRAHRLDDPQQTRPATGRLSARPPRRRRNSQSPIGLRLPALATKPRRIVDVDRAAELLDALPDTERALWATAFYAGLRIGELRALRWTHVDFDRGVIRVTAGWDHVHGEQDTKTQAGTRTVPLVGRLRAELARHKLATGRSGDDLCFGQTATAAMVRSAIRARANRAWKAAGLDALTPHEAPHTCASYLAAAGLTHKEVQTAMGHVDIRTTLNIYAKAVPGWESDAAAKADSYLERAKVARKSVADVSGS